MKKKGETRHHCCYKPEIVVKIPSRGSHLILTSFQSMAATKENIEYIDNYIKALTIIKWEKEQVIKNPLPKETLDISG